MTWDELKTLVRDNPKEETASRAEDVCVGKRPYPTQATAIASLMRYKRASKKHRGRHVIHWQRQRAYKCDICGQYHLTRM